METPVLSHSELAVWAERVAPVLKGARVQRVFVPSFPAHPEGFFKKLWVLDLDTQAGPHQFVFSLMTPLTGAFLLEGRPLKPASAATRSGFDLTLHKELSGKRLDRVEGVPLDRILQIHIGGPTPALLELHLIPARPRGIWMGAASETQPAQPRDPATLAGRTIPHRPERVDSWQSHGKNWMTLLEFEAWSQSRKREESRLAARISTLRDRLRSLEEQAKRSEEEPDWISFARLLQGQLHENPMPRQGFYSLMDWASQTPVQIPADPGILPLAQMEKWFQLARRKKRRIEESRSRSEDLRTEKDRLEKTLSDLRELPAGASLSTLLPATTSPAIPKRDQKRLAGFEGRQYRSKEGFAILVGRNRTENLELTFKIARGNDLWFHVKGRPGCHVVIPLPPGKTASLDTLLDAAVLCLIHSGGKDWGRTEVDYTRQKFVKKIKNSTEVSYTQSRSLIVEVTEERMRDITSRSE
jgi:predicted ribosome quality control (RQC) complex YloA/Tae2 family protein